MKGRRQLVFTLRPESTLSSLPSIPVWQANGLEAGTNHLACPGILDLNPFPLWPSVKEGKAGSPSFLFHPASKQ